MKIFISSTVVRSRLAISTGDAHILWYIGGIYGINYGTFGRDTEFVCAVGHGKYVTRAFTAGLYQA